MIRLSRMTDYGIVVMSQMSQRRETVTTAVELGQSTGLPMPTVSKLLKQLARAGLLDSHRGVNGGYMLTRSLEDITAVDIIEALDGPVALTACVEGAEDACNVESLCPMRGGWDKVNTAIRRALNDVTLAELCAPADFPPAAQVDDTDTSERKIANRRGI